MTGERGVIERQIFIAASPETVFGFLVDPKLMSQWIGIRHALEPHVGGRFHVEISAGNIARGTFTEVTSPRRVAFTWGWESSDPSLTVISPGGSLVEIELEPKDGGTLLRLRHSGLPDVTIPVHRERWWLYLGRLQAAARG
jgi:uncharacterized protein YndB with AHSA1/START domain